jgi:hypothetical protein
MAAVLSAQSATDKQALAMPSLYDAWAPQTAYGGEGEPSIVTRPKEGGAQLYRCRQPHTSQTGWEPENYPAGWVAINNTNAGSVEDPIPAVRGMEYTYGLYYADPEDGKTYLCKRSGEADGGAVVLHYLPHELVGQYFEEVAS